MTAGSLTLALHTAQSGLLATQTALGTVSQNITNVNTPGYSRKIIHLEERVLAGTGAGVQVAAVQRAVDAGLLKDIVNQSSTLNSYKIKEDYFERLESTFGEPGANNSISHILSEFKDAFDSLANTPQSSLNQAEAIRWAENVADKLASTTDTIQELRLQADQEIATLTTRANSIIEDIANLNDKIVRNKAVNSDVSDLLDRRDQNLIELSSILDISYFERDSGEVTVFTKSGRSLVDSEAQPISHTQASAASPQTTHSEGGFTGIYVGIPVEANDITNDLQSGSLKGLVDLRDELLYNQQRELDELSDKLKETINQIHNRGTAYPGSTSLTGSRQFIDPANQTITLGAGDDVRFTIFDNDGAQQATVTLDTILQDAALGSGAQASGGPWSVQEVADTVEDWLQANVGAQASVSFSGGSNGGLTIDLGTTTANLSIRDENARNTLGAAQEDATITFSPTGVAGENTETISGFSNFFGLNDVFVDNGARTTWESDILPDTYRSSGATLTFYDTDTGVGAGNGIPTGGLTIFAGSTLDEIATRINNDPTLNQKFTASVISEGDGNRLRITNSNGKETFVTTGAGQNLFTEIGLKESTIGQAETLNVRADLKQTPGKIASGTMQFDSTLGTNGQYYVSIGDNSAASQIADAFDSSITFEPSGSSVTTSSSLENYVSELISRASSHVANNQSDQALQQATVDSLNFKHDNVKGVNLDEEMSSLILYQQAYSASARVISAIQELFDTLESALR